MKKKKKMMMMKKKKKKEKHTENYRAYNHEDQWDHNDDHQVVDDVLQLQPIEGFGLGYVAAKELDDVNVMGSLGSVGKSPIHCGKIIGQSWENHGKYGTTSSTSGICTRG